MLFCHNCQQDSLYDVVEKGVHHQAICRACGRYIKNMPHDEPKFYFGKYKGQAIKDIDDLSYLRWAKDNLTKLSEHFYNAIEARINELTSPLLK